MPTQLIRLLSKDHLVLPCPPLLLSPGPVIPPRLWGNAYATHMRAPLNQIAVFLHQSFQLLDLLFTICTLIWIVNAL